MVEINKRQITNAEVSSSLFRSVLNGTLRQRGLIEPPAELVALLRAVERDYDLSGLHTVNFYTSKVLADQHGVVGTVPNGERVYLKRGEVHPLSEGLHQTWRFSRDAIINLGVGYQLQDAKHALLHELAHHLEVAHNGQHVTRWMIKNLELQERYTGSIEYAKIREAQYLGPVIVAAALTARVAMKSGTIPTIGASR